MRTSLTLALLSVQARMHAAASGTPSDEVSPAASGTPSNEVSPAPPPSLLPP